MEHSALKQRSIATGSSGLSWEVPAAGSDSEATS
jgi:hypothetical protein